MRRIREVLRLRDEFGFSQRQIAGACRLPRSTVRDYLERLRAAGLRYEDVLSWTDIELEERLFPPPDVTVRPVPDWRHISHELARRGVTLRLLWQEYLDVHPGGYRYTQFVQHFRAWQAAHAQPRLRREHRPGAAIEVDYAGMTLTVGLGADARQAQVFVACLPYSGYLYAEATWTQQLEEWLASHVRLFEHLGGVPAKLVPDNLKVGVSHASFYDPAINPAFQDLARHYRTAVLPARVRRPRDKASAENGVQQIERRVLAPLRDVIFATRWTPPTRLCVPSWPSSTRRPWAAGRTTRGPACSPPRSSRRCGLCRRTASYPAPGRATKCRRTITSPSTGASTRSPTR